METISNETILKLKESIQAKEGQSSYSNGYHKIDVPGYLQHYQIAYSIKQNGTGTIYRLNNCVFDSSHTTNEASIIQDAMGKLYYQCFHNSCKGRTWVEARELISGKDSLKPFMPGAETIMQNFNVAKQLIQDESEKKHTEILSSLETWNSIRALDITIEWIVDRLIPKDSITILFGKGGIGKTWLSMDMARSIASGTPFLGLGTVKTPVIFVDFENPLAVLNTRTQKLGEAEGVFFWRANNDKLNAPKLDQPDWGQYKQLPEGSILIFDTLRASQSRDENKSDEMGMIMGRLKELRDMGFTIILLHHTPKNSDKISKGSTAIVDLADHILGLTLVKKRIDGQEIIVDDEDNDGEGVYRFGVREKTRFEPYQIYLTLNPDRGFELAPDPQEDTLKEMFKCLSEHHLINKTEFLKECKTKINLGEKKIRRLFDIGQGRYWKVEKTGFHNTQMVSPIQFGSLATLYSDEKLQNRNPVWQNERQTDSLKIQQSTEYSEFGSSAKDFCQSAKQAVIEVEDIL